MFRNSLRQRTGVARSGSRSRSASAACVCSPGRDRDASRLESTTIAAGLVAWPDRCRSEGRFAGSMRPFAVSHGQASRLAPALSASARFPGTRWLRCPCCVGGSERRPSVACTRRQGCFSRSRWWAARLHRQATKMVPSSHVPLPGAKGVLRADPSFSGKHRGMLPRISGRLARQASDLR